MQSLTKEQLAPINYLKKHAGNGIIVLVNAVAGSGKSHTATKAVEALKPKKGLYTAFNRSIVDEAKELYEGTPIECRTLHSLALSKVKPKLKIDKLTYECIKEDITYYYKSIIIKAIDEFYRSASLDMEDYISTYIKKELSKSEINKEKHTTIADKLTNICTKYIDLMINDKINPTFNYLLKWFHFMLANEEISVGYDLIIFDEIQDSTAVALEIFKLMNAKGKLGLGDQNQSIYHFMNLVNGFEILDNTVTFSLTQTFRCSTAIAEAVEDFGKKHLSANFHFKGVEHPVLDGKTAFLSATNASIVETINDLHREGQGYILTRPIKDIFAAPLAVLTASTGKSVFHREYKFLEREYKHFVKSSYNSFMTYLMEEVDDEEIRNTVKLLQTFRQKRISIWDVLAEAKKVKRDPRVLVSTAHSCKGLGFETVHINEDLNNAVSRIIDKGGPESEEDKVILKLAYVAVTRARANLHNARFLKL